MMRRLCAVLLTLQLVAGVAVAQFGRPWNQLTPDEQRRARENYERYQRLPEGRQRSMDRRYQRFQAMPREEQQRLRQNYERYRELDPGKRREFTEKYRRWKESGKR
jgi:hypothetical protein